MRKRMWWCAAAVALVGFAAAALWVRGARGPTGDVSIPLGHGQQLVAVNIDAGRLQVQARTLFQGYSLENSAPYLIGVNEITVGQWNAVMHDVDTPRSARDLPKSDLSYLDCMEFVDKLNGLIGPEWLVTLPTEIQWEYACRAGESVDLTHEDEGFDARVWHRDNCGSSTTPPWGTRPLPGRAVRYGVEVQPVCSKEANAWGLHDMLGNVAEWCMLDDTWESSSVLPPSPYAATSTGEGGALRGDSVGSDPRGVSPRSRAVVNSSVPTPNGGFRVVLTAR